jgi:hypothetical protein
MNALEMTRAAAIGTTPAFEPVVAARVGDEWISLAARMPRSPGVVSPWQALLLNAEVTGAAKLVLPAGGRVVEIRADIPVEDGVDVEARLLQARESIQRAASGSPAAPADRASGVIDPVPIDLPALAAEAGWPFILRSSRRVAIDLDVPGRFHQAIVEPRSAGCRARVALAVVMSPSAHLQLALGVLLLTVTGLVRMARAGATEHEGETTVFVETDFAECPTARELHHALSGLAVACRMAGRETKALVDEHIAHAYLAARGWAACP